MLVAASGSLHGNNRDLFQSGPAASRVRLPFPRRKLLHRGSRGRRFGKILGVDAVHRLVVVLEVRQKDARREQFSREKILAGLRRACEKRPVSEAQMEAVAATVERDLFARGESEVPATLIGEKLMESLRSLDKVAYIRFASVYRQFRDVESFQEELASLLAK